MKTYSRGEWALEAVKGIILPKERESAMQELLDHIDDHVDALLSAGLPEQEAKRQAVAAMGDPEETARLLRRAHQPILTRILQAARVCCISLAVIAALALLISLVREDDLLLGWFDGKPFAPEQEWFFGELPDDSILFRRVCTPEARMQVGDYTLKIHKVAIDQRENRWEVNMLVEMDGKYFWQDPPILPSGSRFLMDGQAFDFDHVAFWVSRDGGSYFSWSYLELTEEPDGLTLELPCEGRTYALKIDLRGGETYEKAR